MELHDVTEKEQFEAYYNEKKLIDIHEKIAHLTKSMKIRAIRCDEIETDQENLDSLEELVILGYWKASW
ncbi:MAG: hypothetical protein LBV04_00480 [Deferribacteraceae bacterium]|jgi:hypothetical protein|nr:hypothetical protein [Deferribacteraceae bacterium]